MIKAGPILLKTHLKGLLEELEASDARIAAERELQKAALDASRENHGTEPSCIAKLRAFRRRKAKNPAEASRLEDIEDLYRFLIEGGEPPKHAPEVMDELSRVMALTNTSKPPKIEAIRKALNCSQGKAHKLRSLAAARLAAKSSSSSTKREHEHLNETEETNSRATGGVETQEAVRQGSAVPTCVEPSVDAAGGVDAPAPIPESRFPEPSAPALDVSPRDVQIAGKRDPDDLEIPAFLRRAPVAA